MSERTRAAPAGRPVRANFRPSRDGFAFDNSWPPAPGVTVRTPLGKIGVGNAARGLCGGMTFAALDYWQAGRPPPTARPAPGTALYRYLVRRLIASWHIPSGVARYYRGMLAADTDLAQRTIGTQWPRVRALLDSGQPAALGVVTVASANPLLLGHNHQVVAYAYRQQGTDVTLRVYDPNSGPADDVWIRFAAAATAGLSFPHNVSVAWPVRGFFLTRYTPADPPAS